MICDYDATELKKFQFFAKPLLAKVMRLLPLIRAWHQQVKTRLYAMHSKTLQTMAS